MIGARGRTTMTTTTHLHHSLASLCLIDQVNLRALCHCDNKHMPKTFSERALCNLHILQGPVEAAHLTVTSLHHRKRSHPEPDTRLVLRVATVQQVDRHWKIAAQAIPIAGLTVILPTRR